LEVTVKQLTALTISIGVLAAVATWLFLAVGGILIWAAFLAWACFYHTGGDRDALRNTVVGNVFGSLVGWVAAIVILAVPLAATLTLPIWAAIVVGITVAILVYAANIKAFSVIPAGFYGYAATFAFLLQTPGKLTLANLLSLSLSNAFLVVALSMVIGAVFGYVSATAGAALMKKETAPA
jgi:hypothetical protein